MITAAMSEPRDTFDGMLYHGEVISARAGTSEIHLIVVDSTEFYVANITATTSVRTHMMEWERNSVIVSD